MISTIVVGAVRGDDADDQTAYLAPGLPADDEVQKLHDMHDTIVRYREANGSERPGATWDALRNLQGKLGCVLPPDLIALYRDHDGTEAYTDLPFRFMPVAEVAGWFDMMREYYVVTPDFNCLDHGLCPFWTDDNANYACVYVSGPLIGRVAFLDHEMTANLEPRFRSVESFLEVCLPTSGEGWYEMETDTPEMHPTSDPGLAEQDWKLAQSLERAFADASRDADWPVRWEREYLAGCIMVLTPYDRSEMLFRFAQDEDPFIRQQAFDLLGDRRWEGAVPLLAQAVDRGDQGDQGAAITALGKIGTAFALEHLVPLAPKIPRCLESHFDYALHRCGVYVTKGNGRRYFRLPGSED